MERQIEGAAHPRDLVLFRQACHSLEHRRQQVRVFVRIEMRGLQTGVKDAPHLRTQFVINVNAVEQHRAHKLSDGDGKWRLANQDQVNPDIQRRGFARQTYGVVKRRAGGHERGGRKDTFAVRFDNSSIHVAREAEVVGVNHQFAHVRTSRA